MQGGCSPHLCPCDQRRLQPESVAPAEPNSSGKRSPGASPSKQSEPSPKNLCPVAPEEQSRRALRKNGRNFFSEIGPPPVLWCAVPRKTAFSGCLPAHLRGLSSRRQARGTMIRILCHWLGQCRRALRAQPFFENPIEAFPRMCHSPRRASAWPGSAAPRATGSATARARSNAKPTRLLHPSRRARRCKVARRRLAGRAKFSSFAHCYVGPLPGLQKESPPTELSKGFERFLASRGVHPRGLQVGVTGFEPAASTTRT